MTHIVKLGTLQSMKESHNDWFRRVTRGDSNRRVSDLANISPVTLGRQLNAGTLGADMIIKIAQAYDESPVVALVDLNFISAKWITEVGTTTALTRASDEELTNELLRRLHLISGNPIDQLAARRRVQADDYDDGTVQEWDDTIPHAADSSDDEDAIRYERGEDPID